MIMILPSKDLLNVKCVILLKILMTRVALKEVFSLQSLRHTKPCARLVPRHKSCYYCISLAWNRLVNPGLCSYYWRGEQRWVSELTMTNPTLSHPTAIPHLLWTTSCQLLFTYPTHRPRRYTVMGGDSHEQEDESKQWSAVSYPHIVSQRDTVGPRSRAPGVARSGWSLM